MGMLREKNLLKSTLPLISEEQQAFEKVSIRKFVVPSINMDAKTYPDLFNWTTAEFSEPPLTVNFSNEAIKDFIHTPYSPPDIPCHTQAVERGIRNIGSSHFSYWSRFTRWIYSAEIEVSKGCWLLWVKERLLPCLRKARMKGLSESGCSSPF